MILRAAFSVLVAAACCASSVSQYFAPPVTQVLPSGPGTPSVADIDGDGDGDLVYLNDGATIWANGVIVSVNGGIGAAAVSYYIPIPAAPTHSLDVADIDGDGDEDVVSSNETSFTVIRNTGASVSLVTSTLAAPRSRVALVDWDGDGDRDALFDANEVWLNDGGGNFAATAPLNLLPSPLFGLVTRATDFDIDGDLDLVCVWPVAVPASWIYPSGSTNLWIASFRRDPGDVFTAVQNGMVFQDQRVASFHLADLDADGDEDMVLGTATGIGAYNLTSPYASHLYAADLSNGVLAAIVTTPLPLAPFIDVSGILAPADTDGDGAAEVLAVTSVSGLAGSALAVLWRISASGATRAQHFAMPFAPSSLVLARYDGDLMPDVVAMTGIGPPGSQTSHALTIRRKEAIPGPISLSIVSGDNQVVTSGAGTFPQPFVIHLADGNGMPLAGRDVYLPTVTLTNGGSTFSLSTGPLMTTTNAAGDAALNPGLSTFPSGPFLPHPFALDQSVQFTAFLRKLHVAYSSVTGNLTQTNVTGLSNEPIMVAYDTPGWNVPTQWGVVKTGLLAGPASTTLIRDGLGAFGPPDATMIGDPSGTWSSVDVVPAFLRNSGFLIVIQSYAAPASAPWFVSNSTQISL